MPKAKQGKVPVTMRALIQRINRKLAKERDGWGTHGGGHGDKLLACREMSRAYHDLGSYYTVDVGRNQIAATHVDPEELARELGVLKEWEKVEQ